MNFFDTWQFNLLGFYIFVVLFFQFYKLAVKNAKHDGAATILLQFIGGASILVLLPLFPIVFPRDLLIYLFLIGACIFYALADRLNTTARKNLDVSIFSIIGQLSTVFLLIFGFFLFRETFLWTKVMGAALILGANAFLFYKKGELRPTKYTWVAIVAAAMFAIAVSVDIGISQQFNLPFYVLFTLTVPAVMILLGEKISPRAVWREFTPETKKYYLITGIAWGLAIFFSLRSFQFGPVSTIVPLQSVQVLLNVLIAYFFLKERRDKLKKIIAAFLVIIGVYLTVV